MPLRPQSVGRREFRDIAELQRYRGIEGGVDQLVNQRHAECRDDQDRQHAAEEPGLRCGLPTSDPDQKRSAYRKHREHNQVRWAVCRELPLCREQLDQLPVSSHTDHR